MTYISYRIKQGDTLESIASDVLGSADRWREIAMLNRLRAPFISEEHIDSHGEPLVNGTLTSAILENSTSYAFQASELPVYATLYAKSSLFHIEAATHDAMILAAAVNESSGLLTFKPSLSLSIQDAITASAIAQTVTTTNVTGARIGMKLQVDFGADQETVTLTGVSPSTADAPAITAVFTKSHLAGTLASYGFQYGYAIGTPWILFGPQRAQRLHVLRVGDYVQLPSGSALSAVAQTGDALFIDLLGTDIYLGMDGQVAFGATGDYLRVVGTKNLQQALRLRLNTPGHSYDRYPDYGNPLWDFLGQTTEPYFVALVEGLVRRAILEDPRVSEVRDVTVAINGSTITVNVQIEILQGSQLLRLENLVVGV